MDKNTIIFIEQETLTKEEQEQISNEEESEDGSEDGSARITCFCLEHRKNNLIT